LEFGFTLFVLYLMILLSRESASQPAENNPAMDLINRIQVNDEEGRSRQRVLAFAARKYASAIERNPDDHDALYNWALILQVWFLFVII
jgi:hypothetical protein